MKKAWEGMNNIMNRKTKKLNYNHAIKDYNNGNRLVRNLSCIPNILNDHFASVGHELANQLLDSQSTTMIF